MAAPDVDEVGRGIVFVQRGVAQERASRVAPLEQVVTQDAVVGKAMTQRLFEGIDVIDALADERSFAEQILVDVRDTASVWIDSGRVSLQLCIMRLACAGQAAGQPRLQDAVSFDDEPICTS
jgi:hypothetical protein